MVSKAFLTVLLLVLSVSPAGAQTASIPAGTTIHSRLTQTLSTKVSFQGDPFTAAVSEPVIVNGQTVIPVGATLEGRIAGLSRPGRVRGVGEMRLSIEKITLPGGRSFPLSTMLVSAYGAEGTKVQGEEGSIKGPSSRLQTLEEIGMGMGAGGFLGTLIGGFHGAVVGGAVGGVAGLVDRMRRRGQDLNLPSGTQLNYQLTRPLLMQPEAARVMAPAASTRANR